MKRPRTTEGLSSRRRGFKKSKGIGDGVCSGYVLVIISLYLARKGYEKDAVMKTLIIVITWLIGLVPIITRLGSLTNNSLETVARGEKTC